MKHFRKILPGLFIACIMIVSAQGQNTPTGYAAINFGTAFPVGDYSSGGSASTGYDLYFASGFPIKKSNFGLATKVDYFSNSFNTAKYLADNGFTYVSSASGYNGITALIGGFATIPSGPISFDFRVMGGMMTATLPQLTADAGYGPTSFSKASAIGFAYDAGIGLRVAISKRLCVITQFDYLSSSPTFTWSYDQTINNQPTVSSSTSVSQKFSIISWTGGIGFYY